MSMNATTTSVARRRTRTRKAAVPATPVVTTISVSAADLLRVLERNEDLLRYSCGKARGGHGPAHFRRECRHPELDDRRLQESKPVNGGAI